MDTITAALINLGATGILAAVLFYLHTTALKVFQEERSRFLAAFQEELKAERQQCHEDHEKVMECVQEVSTGVSKLRSKVDILRSEMGRGKEWRAEDEDNGGQ